MKSKIKSHIVLNLPAYSFTVLSDLIADFISDISNFCSDDYFPLTYLRPITVFRNNTHAHNSTYVFNGNTG